METRSNSEFLFVVGPPRSGNSVLMATLDGHPDILAWPTEFPFFNFFQNVSRGRKTVPLNEINEALLKNLEVNLNIRLSHGSDKEMKINLPGSVIGGFDTNKFCELLFLGGKRETTDVEYLGFLFECLHLSHKDYANRPVKYYGLLCTARGLDWKNDSLFKSARFLFPYRDMVESYASIRDKGLKTQTFAQFFFPSAKKGSRYWIQSFEKISRLAEGKKDLSNFHVVSLKRQRTEPDLILSEICQFLEIECHPSSNALSIVGIDYKGNAHENSLNQGKVASRGSKRIFPLSTIEKKLFTAIGLFDFDDSQRFSIEKLGVLDIFYVAYLGAFHELHSKENDALLQPGKLRFLPRRFVVYLELVYLYFALRGGLISRLIPKRSSHYLLDSLD